MATAKIARLPRSAAPLRRPFSNQDRYIETLSGQGVRSVLPVPTVTRCTAATAPPGRQTKEDP